MSETFPKDPQCPVPDAVATEQPKHTPGPWRAGRPDMTSYHGDGTGPFKNVYADDPDGEFHLGERLPAVVAEARDAAGGDCRANATLIAAAPDLLAAAQSLLDLDPEFLIPMRPQTFAPEEWRQWYDSLKAMRVAVAKATTVFPW